MTQKECEEKLLTLMKQAYEIARQYDPAINHLSMFRIEDYTNVRGGLDIGGGIIPSASLDSSRFDKEVSA